MEKKGENSMLYICLIRCKLLALIYLNKLINPVFIFGNTNLALFLFPQSVSHRKLGHSSIMSLLLRLKV